MYVADMRAALVAIQELHCDDGSGNCEECFFHGKEGDWQSVKHPCNTRRLADDALGGGQHG